MTDTIGDEAAEAIVAKTTAPKLSKESIKARIASVSYSRINLITHCVITMVNGFTVTGESAVVSAANYNEDVGRHYAFGKAFDKLWELEAYLLKEALFKQACETAKPPSPAEVLEQARARANDSSHLAAS